MQQEQQPQCCHYCPPPQIISVTPGTQFVHNPPLAPLTPAQQFITLDTRALAVPDVRQPVIGWVPYPAVQQQSVTLDPIQNRFIVRSSGNYRISWMTTFDVRAIVVNQPVAGGLTVNGAVVDGAGQVFTIAAGTPATFYPLANEYILPLIEGQAVQMYVYTEGLANAVGLISGTKDGLITTHINFVKLS